MEVDTPYCHSIKTRTNWPRKVRELVLDSDSQSQGSRGRPTGSQEVKGEDLQGPLRSRGGPIGSQGVKG